MDGVGAATSVVAVLQTAWQVIEYIKAVKGAGEEKHKLLLELIRARGLLMTLGDVVNLVKGESWAQALRAMEGENGALSAFNLILVEIMDALGHKKMSVGLQLPATGSEHSESLDPQPEGDSVTGNKPSGEGAATSSVADSGPTRLPTRKHHAWFQKIHKIASDLKWPFTQPQVEELLQKLDRVKSDLLVALTSDNVRLSTAIKEQVETVYQEIISVQNDTIHLREAQEGTKAWTIEQHLIFQSIQTLDYSSTSSGEELADLKSAAEWFLRGSKFQDWLDGTPGSALLLLGRPGMGKTSVCKVVESYLRARGSSDDIFVISIFFKYAQDWSAAPTLSNVLAFIVGQMLQTHPRFQKYYNKLMLTGEGELELEDSLRIIHRARQDFQHFYTILDGLDECDPDTAQAVIRKLRSLRSPPAMLAASRASQDTINLSSAFSHVVQLDGEADVKDIKGFVKARLLRDGLFTQGTEQTTAELQHVTDAILERCEGNFRMAELLIATIRDEPKAWPSILANSGRNLDELYTQVLE